MSACPKCDAPRELGGEDAEDERFCHACGAELPEELSASASSEPEEGAKGSPRAPVSLTAALLGEGKPPSRRHSKGLLSPVRPATFDTAQIEAPGTGMRKSNPGVLTRNSMNLGVPVLVEVPKEAAVGEGSPTNTGRMPIQKKGSKLKKRDPLSNSPGRTQSQLAWFNQTELLETMHEVFHPESTSGWLLVGYQPDNCTLELQACGDGSISGCLEFLDDKEQQYVMARIPLEHSAPTLMSSRTRDVLIVWHGSAIPIMQRGRWSEHIQLVKQVLQPVHAHLTATHRENWTESLVLERSDPKSGSHEL